MPPAAHPGQALSLWHALRFVPALDGPDALQRRADWALRFTPTVSLASPATLLLDTRASLRYFGGREALERLIRESAGPALLMMASAPTPAAAALLAHWQDGAHCASNAGLPACLARLPIGLLSAARARHAEFSAAGLRQISQLLALPRASLARRFGQPLLDELDRALGHLPDPRPRHAPAPRFDLRLVLPTRIDASPGLSPACTLLIQRLCDWLHAAHRATRSLALDILHEEFPATRVMVRLAEAAWQAERLLAVLNEQLTRLALPAPATGLRLRCRHVEPAGPVSGQLFPEPGSRASALGTLLERLQARLGPGQVQRLAALPDDRPEAAWQASEAAPARADGAQPSALRPALATAMPERASRPAGLPRPLWLLDRPRALGERQGQPQHDGPLQLLAGPERIESGWWDGQPVRRDYFVAVDPAHRLLWIYRAAPGSTSPGAWFLHGSFG